MHVYLFIFLSGNIEAHEITPILPIVSQHHKNICSFFLFHFCNSFLSQWQTSKPSIYLHIWFHLVILQVFNPTFFITIPTLVHLPSSLHVDSKSPLPGFHLIPICHCKEISSPCPSSDSPSLVSLLNVKISHTACALITHKRTFSICGYCPYPFWLLNHYASLYTPH